METPTKQCCAEVYEVEPSRFAAGSWCERRQATIGRGDIAGAYSADKIAFGEPVRKPFEWRGALWLNVGANYSEPSVQAYRLEPPEAFAGEPVSYADKVSVQLGEAARRDPLGFYHGMLVERGARRFVMCGPPVRFKAGRKQQLDLFGGD